MMDGSRLPPEFERIANALADAKIFNHGHLPVAAAYCRRLGLVELINDMVPSQMAISPGLVVQAMVLDVLSGRSPLYRIESFMAKQDIELLLGERVPASAFNDNNVVRSMDATFPVGTSKILTRIGMRAIEMFRLNASVVSYDTTSTSVWGEYRVCGQEEEPPPGPNITYGHSKDDQPGLKQFMTELLCVERGVPIFGRTLDGNSSDKKSNNEILTRISAIMAKQGLGAGAFIYVADSAMVTEANLQAVGPNRFITRLPATYGECGRVVLEAVKSGEWMEIGKLAEMPASTTRPCAQYKAIETTVTLYGKDYRAVVVHSSSHDKRRRKKLEKSQVKSTKEITAALGKFQKVYFCEADAHEAAKQARNLSDGLHIVNTTVRPVEKRRRGRPPIGRPAPTDTRYELTWTISDDPSGVATQKTLAGCFVLLSNVPTEGDGALDAVQVLKTYKGQYGVESNFAFLKDPLVVNDLFLKTPSRIDVLGMILVIALMIWRLMERSMRMYIDQGKTTLPGWDRKRTTKPTSFMMSIAMTGIMVALLRGSRALLKGPGDDQAEFLAALGLTADVFIDPRYRAPPNIPSQKELKG